MGVPTFFRWSSLKYPKIVSHCKEEKKQYRANASIDTRLPNPNKIEFDNLYLDMNGIIHPCTHPENKPAPKNEEEMFIEIFRYIDRIFAIVRPRRLVYMAVDGVAPRAKMNQQRSRRFRAGKEDSEKRLTIERIRSELLEKGAKLPEPKTPSDHFDSNCITPGTSFMARLSIALQYYVYYKLHSDPGWKNIQVILSDANVPGEGEHKIINYIRNQRRSATHDPNTKHCLCGADADLIMLGLATHERYFTIIREEFKPNQPRPCEICGQLTHDISKCKGLTTLQSDTVSNRKIHKTQFIFIHLDILREYLKQELIIPNLNFPYDFERAIDDWVFMCFFAGNDFLPHLPSLEIRENAIDHLIEIYKDSVSKKNTWLTDNGRVDISCIQIIMNELALLEDRTLKSHNRNGTFINRKYNGEGSLDQGQRLDHEIVFKNPDHSTISLGNFAKKQTISESQKKVLSQDKNNYVKIPKIHSNKVDPEYSKNSKRRLMTNDHRSRYYQTKFHVSVEESSQIGIKVAHQYLRGLCWVLAYYYQGCVSWTWYYPFHYAPFAADFVNLDKADIGFDQSSKPFNPLEQLMGVFPANSKEHVPSGWRDLMTDPESPIIDFYPKDFNIDLNGKRHAWQGVVLLPFVDEKKLLKVLEERYSSLTGEEKARNATGSDRYFVRTDHSAANAIKFLYKLENYKDSMINPEFTNGVTGRISADMKAYRPNSKVKSPIGHLCKDIFNVKVISCFYMDS